MRLYELAASRYHDTQNRCVSCGFLGKHKADWFEVSQEERDKGILYNAYSGGIGTKLGCLRNAADLAREYSAALEGKRLVDAEGITNVAVQSAVLRDVLNNDRKCAEWYPYTPGFSPKEHVEQLQMMQLEEDRRKYEMSLAQLQSKSEERAASIAESLHQVTVQTGKFTTRWTYIAVGLAAAALLVVLSNYLFPDAGRAIGSYISSHVPTP